MTGALTARPRLGLDDDRRNIAVFLGWLGMIEPVANAVDELLHREQGDQRAGKRDRRIERGDRRPRWQPEAAEAPDIIDVAKIDEAGRHAEHDDADNDLDDHARRAVHRIRDRGQVQMIVAPGGDGGPDEDRVDEQRRGDFLQPQPGMADGPRDDVSRHRQRKSEAQHAAHDHQEQFEPVERLPFQMTLSLQHQFVGDSHRLNPRRPVTLSRRPGERRDP